MTGWLDPPHERVLLTPAERRAVVQLERSYREPSSGSTAEDARASYGAVGARNRTLASALRWAPFAPWLLPVGVVLVGVALPFSVAVSALGATLVLGGLAACVARTWRWWHGTEHLPSRFHSR
jgi:hypothetical protein